MKEAGAWDWSGSCDPHARSVPWATFSVGCFQWVAKASGRGVKRGKVAKRFSGSTSNPQAVYDQAQAWCDARNAGRAGAEGGGK